MCKIQSILMKQAGRHCILYGSVKIILSFIHTM